MNDKSARTEIVINQELAFTDINKSCGNGYETASFETVFFHFLSFLSNKLTIKPKYHLLHELSNPVSQPFSPILL